MGGSENKLEPTRMHSNPPQFSLPLTIKSRLSYGSWTFHCGAEHIPGPGVKEAEGKTRETGSKLTQLVAQAKEVSQQLSGDNVCHQPQKGYSSTSPS